MLRRTLFLVIPGLLVFPGCGGDVTGAVGEYGRIRYSLLTHYTVEEQSLLDGSIVTGHEQEIHTQLTQKGEKKVDEPADIRHVVTPDEGVTLDVIESENDIPDFRVTVTTPGPYTFESYEDDGLIDRITLTFDAPDDLEVVTWLRPAGAEEFAKVEDSGPVDVQVGAQVAFLPIPTAGGERLIGDIHTEVEADPADAVVRGQEIVDIYEEAIWTSDEPPTLYFIAPGEVTVTLSDAVHELSVSRTFVVAP